MSHNEVGLPGRGVNLYPVVNNWRNRLQFADYDSEIVRMSIMCPACQAIMPGLPGTEPHDELGHQGFIYCTQRGREGSREDRFRCLACEAKWLRETDKWGTDLGFKLAP